MTKQLNGKHINSRNKGNLNMYIFAYKRIVTFVIIILIFFYIILHIVQTVSFYEYKNDSIDIVIQRITLII